tara:strand:- start:10454 stop:11554 length:1101 start_codon:yes stop_codon:yes gene_type:complete
MTKLEEEDQDYSLETVGERYIKDRIIARIQNDKDSTNGLVGGLGHDAGILNNPLGREDKLLINTDRSGVNKAYNMGISDGECIGDFAISHAISDIIATGGIPFAVSVALLLPGATKVGLVDEIVDGITNACRNYDVTLTGGDTKKSKELSLVVTALGRAPLNRLLYRNRVSLGDQLFVTGHLGSMLLGSAVLKRGHSIPAATKKILETALIQQRPPYQLGLAVSETRVASACTDISDGLQAACRNMLVGTDFGIEINEEQIPIDPKLKKLASSMSLTPFQLSLAGGDWQFLYCIPKESVKLLEDIRPELLTQLTAIGEVIENEGVWGRSIDGRNRKLRQIEHDSFLSRIDGKSYFEFLSDPQDVFE